MSEDQFYNLLYKLNQLEEHNETLLGMCKYLIQSNDELRAKLDSIESKLNSSKEQN